MRELVAATRLQLWGMQIASTWRSRRRAAMYLYPLRSAAASAIQKAARCRFARAAVGRRAAEHSEVAKDVERRSAAYLIQLAWLAREARRRVAIMRAGRDTRCASLLARVYRGHVARGRARLVRKERRAETRERKAVLWGSVALQSAWRSHAARRVSEGLWRERSHARATSTIQCAARMWHARNAYAARAHAVEKRRITGAALSLQVSAAAHNLAWLRARECAGLWGLGGAR